MQYKMIMQFFVGAHEFKVHVGFTLKYKHASIINSHRTMYYIIAHVLVYISFLFNLNMVVSRIITNNIRS